MAKRLTKKEREALRFRADKKRAAVKNLSNSITRLRQRVSTDLRRGDERDQLTAAIVRIMDRTAARVGNDASASKGHFGVTGLQCRHVSVKGNRIDLEYVGKSGVAQKKGFSDADVARVIGDCLRRCRRGTSFVFVTSSGFRVKADRVNRYLSRYGVTAKDLRGYGANRFMVAALRKYRGQISGEKARKKAFMAELRKVAKKVGHTPATLRKHYLIDGFESNYVSRGQFPRL